MKKTDILDVVSRKLSPYIFVFGFYLVSFGHISPGGGFQGGVVIAAGLILLALSHDVGTAEIFFPGRSLSVAEAVSYLALLLAGILGVLVGVGFLGNAVVGVVRDSGIGLNAPLARIGFIFLLNVLIGVKVAAGVSLICIHLFREHGP